MARRAKALAKRGRTVSNFSKPPTGELLTLLDFVRYAVSRFVEAKLVFAHGTTDPVAEAAFLVCETLHLHPDQFETFATARVTAREAKAILEVIARRAILPITVWESASNCIGAICSGRSARRVTT